MLFILIDEQHLAVFRQRPHLVGDNLLEAIHNFAEACHGGDDTFVFAFEGAFHRGNRSTQILHTHAQRLHVGIDTREALVESHLVSLEGAGVSLDDLRQDDVLRHVAADFAFDVNALVEIFDVDFVAGFHFAAVHHAILFEQLNIFFLREGLECFHGGADIRESAAFGFGNPFIGIAIAVEDHALVFLHDLLQNLLQARVEVLLVEFLELFRNHVERFGHDGVQNHVRLGAALAGTRSAEFELVAGERKRRSPIAVGSVAREGRKHVGTDAECTGLLRGLGHALFNLFNHVHQLIAKEHGDNCRRSFVRTEAVIVARTRNRHAEQVGVSVDGVDDGAKRGEEHGILVRVLARVEQVALAVRERPVVVLAGTVHAGERLFVQQAHETILVGHVAEHFHNHHVVVASEVHFLEHRGEFELRGRDFVVAGLRRNAELPEFGLDFVHEVEDAGRNATEVMVVHLLVLCRSGTEQRAAGLVQVGALQVEALVDEEIFLFGTERDGRLLGARLEAGHKTAGRLGKSLQAAEERSLLVERFAGVTAECRRDAERSAVTVTLDEGRRSRVPGGVAAGFERGTQTAARERRCVRFADDEVLAAERHDGAAAVRFQEGIVLLGGRAGKRLEPMSEMRSTAVHRPLLHGMGHVGSDGGVKGGALVDGRNQLFADVLRKVGTHGLDIENVLAVEIDIDRGGRQYGGGRGLRDFVDCLFAVAYAHLEPHFGRFFIL